MGLWQSISGCRFDSCPALFVPQDRSQKLSRVTKSLEGVEHAISSLDEEIQAAKQVGKGLIAASQAAKQVGKGLIAASQAVK